MSGMYSRGGERTGKHQRKGEKGREDQKGQGRKEGVEQYRRGRWYGSARQSKEGAGGWRNEAGNQRLDSQFKMT